MLFWIIMLLFVVQTLASRCGSVIADLFDYTWIDQDDIFMRISVHHTVQMVIAMLIIIIIEKTKSIMYPMLMHGLSNFIMVGAGYIFAMMR